MHADGQVCTIFFQPSNHMLAYVHNATSTRYEAARDYDAGRRRSESTGRDRGATPPSVDYLERPRECFLWEEVSRNFLIRSEIALGVPDPLRAATFT